MIITFFETRKTYDQNAEIIITNSYETNNCLNEQLKSKKNRKKKQNRKEKGGEKKPPQRMKEKHQNKTCEV